jgi:hypothetical protein
VKERWAEPIFWGAIASAVLTVIGALAPWAKAKPPTPPIPLPIQIPGSITIGNGTDVGVGWMIIALAVIAAGCLVAFRVRRMGWAAVAAALAGLVACGAAVYASSDLRRRAFADLPPISRIIHPGWGIFVTIVASAALAVTSAALFFVSGRSSQPEASRSPAA